MIFPFPFHIITSKRNSSVVLLLGAGWSRGRGICRPYVCKDVCVRVSQMCVCKNLSISNTCVILDICIYFCKFLHIIIKIKSVKKKKKICTKQTKKSLHKMCLLTTYITAGCSLLLINMIAMKPQGVEESYLNVFPVEFTVQLYCEPISCWFKSL